MESEEARASLLQAVEISVKELERIFCGEELTTKVWQVRYLSEQLDQILLYGLRTPLYGYWPFVKEFSHEETTREIISLPKVNSNLGYGRAWLLGALQSGLVVCYFQSFVYNRKLVTKYYLDNALLRDTLRLKVTIHYLARLSNLRFAFVTNDSSLDQPTFFSTKKGTQVNGFHENNNHVQKISKLKHDLSFSSSDDGDDTMTTGNRLTVQADVHDFSAAPLLQDPPSGQFDSFGPDSLEQAIELVEGVPLDEIEVSGAERFDIAQLLAKESLLKYVEELFEEENESFYKVFLSYYYRVEQQHLSLIFLVLTNQRLILLKTTDGYSLTLVASLPLLHIRQLWLALDYQAIEVVWTSPREVFRSPAYVPAKPTGANLQLVMLCAEQCTWVVSHLEVAMRRLGVKDQALPIIKHNCRPVTLLLKDWSSVRHVLWGSCERFSSREVYERNASLSRMIVSRLYYRNVPKRLQRGMESTILWRSARFELKGTTLEQYDLESDVTPTAVYSLADPACGGVQLCMENPKPFSFRVLWSNEPNLELAAESEFEFSEWLHSLLRSYQKHRGNGKSASPGKNNVTQGTMGASLCSVVLESDTLLICQGPEVRESIKFRQISSIATHHNSFLVECVQQKDLTRSKKDPKSFFTWLISFYGEAEAQVFFAHLKHFHSTVTCRFVRDSTTQGICCEPREKAFNQMCSYAAKFCDIIA